MLINRGYLVTFALCSIFYIHPVIGQYYSGISRPDSNVVLTRDSVYKMAQTIQTTFLQRHLKVFASDEFDGRAFNKPGNTKAIRYIAAQLHSMGVRPGNDTSYFQEVLYHRKFWDKIRFTQEDHGRIVRRFVHKQSFFSSYIDHFDSLDLRFDKVVRLPCLVSSPDYTPYSREIDGSVVVLEGCSPVVDTVLIDYHPILHTLHQLGATLVLIVDPQFNLRVRTFNESTYLRHRATMGPPPADSGIAHYLFLTPKTAGDLFPNNQPKKRWWQRWWCRHKDSHSYSLSKEMHIIQAPRVIRYSGDNVLAYFPGTGDNEQLITLTAHPDHLPPRGTKIYNGADDNGSGSMALLAIARALQEAETLGFRPKKSILLLWCNGEESGLLGSRYYVRHPVFPLSNTVAEINVDMIGRVVPAWEKDSNYLYVIGSDRISPTLHALNESVNRKYGGLILDYKYNSEEDPNRYYYRSDHYNFAEHGIPSIFFFNGVHQDYHRPTDTVDKICWNVYTRRTRYLFTLLWTLANTDQTLTKYIQLR